MGGVHYGLKGEEAPQKTGIGQDEDPCMPPRSGTGLCSLIWRSEPSERIPFPEEGTATRGCASVWNAAHVWSNSTTTVRDASMWSAPASRCIPADDAFTDSRVHDDLCATSFAGECLEP